MNMFIDCEFNGFGGDLISMAIVADDGSEFYEVLNLENDYSYNKWVATNVVPYLDKEPITVQLFQQRLWEFINKWQTVHIIADWPDDIKYFCQSLITGPGIAINTPPKLTIEIDRTLNTSSSRVLHNALEDARAIKYSWEHQNKHLG